MKKIGFIVDGSSTLSEKELKENDIRRLSFKIIENDSISFNDNDSKISYEKIHSVHKENKNFKTSLTPLGEVIDLIDEELKNKDFVLIFPINKTLSSQYNAIKILETEPEYKNKIYVIDTQAQCYGIDYMVLESIKMIKNGESTEEVIKFAEEQNEYIFTSFVSESSKPATSSGRLSKISIGKVLDKAKITLVLNMNQKISLNSFTRSYTKAIEKMVFKMKKILDETDGAKKFLALYTSLCDDNYKKFIIDEIIKQFKINEKEIIIKNIPKIIFTNTGRNSFGLALGLTKKYKKE